MRDNIYSLYISWVSEMIVIYYLTVGIIVSGKRIWASAKSFVPPIVYVINSGNLLLRNRLTRKTLKYTHYV